MLKIAITGNIASGKSLFEKCLVSCGFKVLCLDEVTDFLYKHSDVFKDFLLKKFNTTVKSDIAAVIFSDLTLKTELENFIYPLILEKMHAFFAENKSEKFLFISAAMLYEAGFDKYFDKVVLISAPVAVRLERLMTRNNISKAAAMKRIDAQLCENIKKRHADYIIDNSGTIEDLKDKTKNFINMLLKEH